MGPRLDASVWLWWATTKSSGFLRMPLRRGRTMGSGTRNERGTSTRRVNGVERAAWQVLRGRMGQGDVDAIDDLLADDYVDHTPPPGFEPSREAQKQVAAFMRDTSSDKSIDLRVITIDGDRAAVYWTMAWTQHGDFFGAPADGKRTTMRGADFYRLRDGRIAETWHVEDMLGAFIQLGMTPKR